ncbi:MAG: NusG domain II-containing protein [Spirochaetales bacterium]
MNLGEGTRGNSSQAQGRSTIKVLDGAALVLSLLILGVFTWYAYADPGGEAIVYIQNVTDAWMFPLNRDTSLDIPGPLGNTHVILQNGAAFVDHSPCRDKICIHMGKIRRNGEWIACLPNRVFLRIQSKQEEEVDASTF